MPDRAAGGDHLCGGHDGAGVGAGVPVEVRERASPFQGREHTEVRGPSGQIEVRSAAVL